MLRTPITKEMKYPTQQFKDRQSSHLEAKGEGALDTKGELPGQMRYPKHFRMPCTGDSMYICQLKKYP